MKHTRLLVGLLVVCVLASAVGCGSSEPIIETPAAEMNLTTDDLGPNWSLDQEQDRDELLADAPAYAMDANLRAFVSLDPFGVITSLVFTTKSVVSARSEMQGEFIQDLLDSIEEATADTSFEETEPPAIGDEAVSLGGSADLSGMEMNVYTLIFRKDNVIVMLFLVGPGDFANKDNATDYGRMLEAKIH